MWSICTPAVAYYFDNVAYQKYKRAFEFVKSITWNIVSFYVPQLYRQVLLRRVLAMGNWEFCPSVCLSVMTRWYTKPR